MIADRPVSVVFVAGHGRCGSTLLDLLLGNQEPFVSVGELSFLWTRGVANNDLCGCGLPFRGCDFWRGVLARTFDGQALDLGRILALKRRVERFRRIPGHMLARGAPRASASSADLATYTGILARLYRAIQRESGRSTIVDSSKYPRTLYLLRRTTGIHCYVVHLVRDSRASAFSWQRQRVRPEVQSGLAYMDRYNAVSASAHWLVNNTLAEAARFFFRDYLRVRYEDLVASPATVLAEIRNMVGASSPTVEGGAHREGGAAHTVAGNPVRFQRGAPSLRPDDEWRRAMRPFDRRVVTCASWPWLMHYGYPLRVTSR